MGRDYKVSVAVATYNGEDYIKEQLESILINLEENDEVIISDDGSTDGTLDIVKKINDKRISVIAGPKKGVIKNFENAIKKCKGKYIFLSDQDDIWMKNKVNEICNIFENEKVRCIVHDAEIVNEDATEIINMSYFKFRNTKPGKLRNFIKPSYLGCCMAFNKEMCKYLLPFPEGIEMHDRWIGSICDVFDTVKFYEKKLIKYRRHKNNVSRMKRNKIITILKNRVILFNLLIKRKKECRNLHRRD